MVASFDATFSPPTGEQGLIQTLVTRCFPLVQWYRPTYLLEVLSIIPTPPPNLRMIPLFFPTSNTFCRKKKPKTKNQKKTTSRSSSHSHIIISFDFFPLILLVADEYLGFITLRCSSTVPPHRNLYLFSAVRLYSVAVRLCGFSGSLLASGKRYTPHARKRQEATLVSLI